MLGTQLPHAVLATLCSFPLATTPGEVVHGSHARVGRKCPVQEQAELLAVLGQVADAMLTAPERRSDTYARDAALGGGDELNSKATWVIWQF